MWNSPPLSGKIIEGAPNVANQYLRILLAITSLCLDEISAAALNLVKHQSFEELPREKLHCYLHYNPYIILIIIVLIIVDDSLMYYFNSYTILKHWIQNICNLIDWEEYSIGKIAIQKTNTFHFCCNEKYR